MSTKTYARMVSSPAPAASRLSANSEASLERKVSERFPALDGSDVSSFLRAHRAVSELLLESVPSIERIFGTETPVILHAVNDHDSDNNVSLVARIQTRGSVAEAREKRKRLYREWWNVNLGRAQGRLHFDIDFV